MPRWKSILASWDRASIQCTDPLHEAIAVIRENCLHENRRTQSLSYNIYPVPTRKGPSTPYPLPHTPYTDQNTCSPRTSVSQGFPAFPYSGFPRSSRDKQWIYHPILPSLPQKESRDSVPQVKCGHVRLFDLQMYPGVPLSAEYTELAQGCWMQFAFCINCINTRYLGRLH